MEAKNPEYIAVGKKALERLKELEASNGWKQNGVKPCKMYKMQVQGRVAARGIALSKFPLEKVYQFLAVTENLKKINSMCTEVKSMQKNDVYEIIYMKYAGIWPVEDRDFVTIGYEEKLNPNKYYIATSSCSFPYPEQKKVVRGQIYVGGYIIERIGQNETQITYVADTDLKGSIPSMIKNTLSSKQGGVPSQVEQAMKQAKM